MRLSIGLNTLPDHLHAIKIMVLAIELIFLRDK